MNKKSFVNPEKMLVFKKKDKLLKKVLIYGEDGTGKSTFAEEYCKKNKLNPVVFDIEDTNCTNLGKERSVKLDLKNSIRAKDSIIKTIDKVKESEFDTIIFDGVSTLLEILVSSAKGVKKYNDRKESFAKILNTCLDSELNLIFIGQIDMKVIYTEEYQSNKSIIKVNSLVNEKYLCKKNGGKYEHEVMKYRA